MERYLAGGLLITLGVSLLLTRWGIIPSTLLMDIYPLVLIVIGAVLIYLKG